MLYQQQKYNLLREETEGYAKLAVAIAQLPLYSHNHISSSPSSPPSQVELHINHIFALVGQFDLDPNRVLDIILDAFEHQCWNSSFVQLLKTFKQSNIAAIIGFKFVNYHQNPVYKLPTATTTTTSTSTTTATATATATTAVKTTSATGTTKDAKSTPVAASVTATNGTSTAATTTTTTDSTVTTHPSPVSLYMLAATLLANKLLTLEQLYPYLEPSVDDICQQLKSQETRLRAEIMNYGVVSLTATATSTAATSTHQSSVPPPPSGRPPLPPVPAPRTAAGGSSSQQPPPPPLPASSGASKSNPSTSTNKVSYCISYKCI